MLPDNRDASYLWDMCQAASGLVKAMKNVDLEEYQKNEDFRLMVERRLEIIGEAARRISEDFKSANLDLPWRRMIAQRNFLIHEYDEIDDERVWRLTVDQIPELLTKLELLLPPSPTEIEDR